MPYIAKTDELILDDDECKWIIQNPERWKTIISCLQGNTTNVKGKVSPVKWIAEDLKSEMMYIPVK